MKAKKKHRTLIGQGYIWFIRDNYTGLVYDSVILTKGSNGLGARVPLNTGTLSGSKKVKLYAE